MADDRAYTILRTVSASATSDGKDVIITFSTPTEDLPLAIPLGEVSVLIAMLCQAAGQAQAVVGAITQQFLESRSCEVYLDEDHLVLNFRLEGGLDLPIQIPRKLGVSLIDDLSASLDDATGSQSGKTRQ
jgi:hypothetical protein